MRDEGVERVEHKRLRRTEDGRGTWSKADDGLGYVSVEGHYFVMDVQMPGE
jgi:hypothetical protein